MQMSKVIGKRIQDTRKKLGLSQAQLGSRCGWEDGQARVSHYENGRREIKIDDLISMSRGLGTSVAYLAGETDDETTLTPLADQELHHAAAVSAFCQSISKASLADIVEITRSLNSNNTDETQEQQPTKNESTHTNSPDDGAEGQNWNNVADRYPTKEPRSGGKKSRKMET